MTDVAVDPGHEPTRRDFIHIATGAVAAVGGGLSTWAFIDQMNPAADTRALASTEVDVSAIPEGGEIKIMWRGRPQFVRHRTAANIEAARAVDVAQLKDRQARNTNIGDAPATDENRALDPKYLIMGASCTHLGCVPLGDGQGDYGGWFCPCHGSHYDTAGRIRKGPAPENLPIPDYAFIREGVIKIGLSAAEESNAGWTGA